MLTNDTNYNMDTTLNEISSQYKTLYDYFEQAEQKANYYKANPEQHLKDMFAAKTNGSIK